MSSLRTSMAQRADAIKKCVPMISVPDVAATLAWYASIGFQELNRFEEDGVVNFGMVSFGKAELMLRLGEKPSTLIVSLWLYTDRVDDLYKLQKEGEGIDFVEEIYDPFWGGRDFGIGDLNVSLLFFPHPAAAKPRRNRRYTAGAMESPAL